MCNISRNYFTLFAKTAQKLVILISLAKQIKEAKLTLLSLDIRFPFNNLQVKFGSVNCRSMRVVRKVLFVEN